MFVVVCILAVGAAVGVGAAIFSHRKVGVASIPASVQTAVHFQLYAPTVLPGTFRISPTSYSLQENASIVVFTATDETGSTINITEQAKPNDLNFANFYATQMQNTATLDDVPYSSVWGKSPDGGRNMLSVVTDTTWILVSSTAPITEDNMKDIAKGLRPQ